MFVRDRQLGTTERVSVDSSGRQVTGRSFKPSISDDGRLVTFQSLDQNLAPEDGICCDDDVFVHDRRTGATARVSVKRLTDRGVEPAGASVDGDISSDGRYVAFIGPCDTLAPCRGFAEPQVFLRDLQTAMTVQLTFGNSGAGGKANPDVSAGGRFVAFEAYGTDLVPGDTNGTGDVFVVNTATKAITRVSVDSGGNQGNGNSFSTLLGPAISDDKVAFESFATNLVPGDTNGARDVFVHVLSTGQTTRESVDSAGNQAIGPSTGSAISGDGNWVGFVSSANNLVPGDTGHTDTFVHQLSGGPIPGSTSTTSPTTTPTSSSSTVPPTTSTTSISTSTTSTTSSTSSTSTSTSTSTTTTVAPTTTTIAPTPTTVPPTTTTVPPPPSTLPPNSPLASCQAKAEQVRLAANARIDVAEAIARRIFGVFAGPIITLNEQLRRTANAAAVAEKALCARLFR